MSQNNIQHTMNILVENYVEKTIQFDYLLWDQRFISFLTSFSSFINSFIFDSYGFLRNECGSAPIISILPTISHNGYKYVCKHESRYIDDSTSVNFMKIFSTEAFRFVNSFSSHHYSDKNYFNEFLKNKLSDYIIVNSKNYEERISYLTKEVESSPEFINEQKEAVLAMVTDNMAGLIKLTSQYISPDEMRDALNNAFTRSIMIK